VLEAGVRHVQEEFASEAVVLLPDGAGQLVERRRIPAGAHLEPGARAVAQWAYEHRQVAGAESLTSPEAAWRCVPLMSPRQTTGVLAVRPGQVRNRLTTEQARLLETFANQLALAFERTALWEEARQAQVQAETERLRSALLSSISHDLRSPLAAITGAASSLLDGEKRFDAGTRRELTEAIHEEADRMTRLVTNLLDMTRLESGIRVRKEAYPLEDVIATALSSLDRRLGGRPILTRLPDESPLVPLDPVLVEQVLVNLLENAIKYTPPDSPLEVSARVAGGAVIVEVADRGAGLSPGDEERAFEKFYRGPAPGVPGAGLGLAICRGIIDAHGGRIWAENRPGGGAAFRFSLPLDDAAPKGQPPDA
jgi:two-component system sensor histidine kinase KdpD